MFNLEKLITIETDVSDYVIGVILNQPNDEGRLYLVAYSLRKFNSTEKNYNVYDKELLVIVEVYK